MVIDKLDKIDKGIITMLQNDPNITHNDIAEKMNRSQPAIGARIKNLTKSGILNSQYGIDFKKIKELNLVLVKLTSNNPQKLIKSTQNNPYIINILKISGQANILVFLAGTSLKRIDFIIDKYFRKSPLASNVQLYLVTDFATKFVMPMKFAVDDFKDIFEPVDERMKNLANNQLIK